MAQWEKMCLSKVRFPDEYVARARAQQVIDMQGERIGALWVYQCPNCRGWHMTSNGYLNAKTHAVTKDDMFDETQRQHRRNRNLQALENYRGQKVRKQGQGVQAGDGR